MSGRVVSELIPCFGASTDLSTRHAARLRQRLVLLQLVCYAKPKLGYTIAELAGATGLNEDYVRPAIRSLRRRSLVTVASRETTGTQAVVWASGDGSALAALLLDDPRCALAATRALLHWHLDPDLDPQLRERRAIVAEDLAANRAEPI